MFKGRLIEYESENQFSKSYMNAMSTLNIDYLFLPVCEDFIALFNNDGIRCCICGGGGGNDREGNNTA
jgi:hypothetical protein